MEYQEYIKQKSEFYDLFLRFIDSEDQEDEHFNELTGDLKKKRYEEKTDEFKSILYIISENSKNHHRTNGFFTKIERIISHYSEYIKRSFSKHELLKIFKKSPRILHFLFKQNIIAIDDGIVKQLLDKGDNKFNVRLYGAERRTDFISAKERRINKRPIFGNYKYYFFNDIKMYLDEETRNDIEQDLLSIDENIFENFEMKCMTGENDSYVGELIRNDNVEEFISYATKVNLHLNSRISDSIFETNPFLIENGATLIEYAAFFGSIQIFNYLRMNEVRLSPSLWLYSIHGNNADIIHILEENNVDPPEDSCIKLLKESIKCHHNNIARYIEDSLLNERIEIDENNMSNQMNPVSFGFHYRNYEFIQYQIEPSNFQLLLFYACMYDYCPIVDLLIKTKKVDINKTIIQKFNIYKITYYILKSSH